MSKYLTSIALLAAGFGPLLIDIGATHLLNPDWDAHARVHEVWRLSTNTLIAILGLYLLWIKQREFLAALLSLCLLIGFWISVFLMPFYDGLPVGDGINELSPLGIPLNIFSFGVVLFIQIIGLILLKNNRSII
ncbi:hypothetical protein N9386_01190 [Gammaproteobacteria bacterium]|nr:hypothetical protein [Gammaproteobacteria bacterium]